MVLRLMHRPRRKSTGDCLAGQDGSNLSSLFNMTKRRASCAPTLNGDASNKPLHAKHRGSIAKPAPSKERTLQTKIIVWGCVFLVLSVIAYEFRHHVSSGFDAIFGQKPIPRDQVVTKNRNVQTSGWRPADELTAQEYGSEKCTIEKRRADQISVSEFEKVYRFKKPVILTFSDGASGWTDPSKWTVSSLKQEYGEWSVLSGNAREIVRRGGSGYTDTSFTEYVDRLMSSEDSVGEPYYVFDREFYNDSSLPSTLHPPPYLEIKDGVDDSIFFLGSSRSGVSFHKHADAWNGVVFGRKRWFLYPTETTPPGGVYPGFTQTEWYHNVYPKLSESQQPMECVQEPGEILYLPEGTYHGTINLGDTIAIGIQKKEATTEIEKLFYEEHKMKQAMQRAGDNMKRRQKYSNKATKIMENLLQLLPDNSEINMKVGQVYKDLGKLDRAVKLTKRAIEIDPFFLVAILNLAGTYSQLGEPEQAETLYKRCMEMNPRLWDVYAQYGDFLLNEDRAEDAVSIYRKGTELEPDNVPFWQHLHMAQERSGDTEGARHTMSVINRLTSLSTS